MGLGLALMLFKQSEQATNFAHSLVTRQLICHDDDGLIDQSRTSEGGLLVLAKVTVTVA